MNRSLMNRTLKTSLIAASLLALSSPVLASAFWPGTAINITPADTLKVRLWPASTSQIIDAYALNANISMTGRCKNIVTNVSFRIDGAQSVNWKYNRMNKPKVWCQVMTDGAQLGWVRGKFVWPQ